MGGQGSPPCYPGKQPQGRRPDPAVGRNAPVSDRARKGRQEEGHLGTFWGDSKEVTFMARRPNKPNHTVRRCSPRLSPSAPLSLLASRPLEPELPHLFPRLLGAQSTGGGWQGWQWCATSPQFLLLLGLSVPLTAPPTRTLSSSHLLPVLFLCHLPPNAMTSPALALPSSALLPDCTLRLCF